MISKDDYFTRILARIHIISLISELGQVCCLVFGKYVDLSDGIANRASQAHGL